MSASQNKNEHNENFMSRWSRRKQEVALENQAEEKQDENSQEEVIAKSPEETLVEIPVETPEEKLAKLNALTDEDMPDVETLGEDSEYAGFMSVNVSEELRKLALQKLFHGKSYNFRDGLDEYDEDYTSFEKLDPSVITADMRHAMEVEAEKLLASTDEDDDLDLENDLESDVDGEVEEMDEELEVASTENKPETEISSELDKAEELALAEKTNSEHQGLDHENQGTNQDANQNKNTNDKDMV